MQEFRSELLFRSFRERKEKKGETSRWESTTDQKKYQIPSEESVGTRATRVGGRSWGRGRGWKTLVDGLSIDPVFQFSWRNSLDAWCPELRLFRLLRPGAGNLADRIDEKFRPRLPPFSSSCEHLWHIYIYTHTHAHVLLRIHSRTIERAGIRSADELPLCPRGNWVSNSFPSSLVLSLETR